MGLLRVKINGEMVSECHCISRIVGGERLLSDRGKEILRRQIWRVSDFCGVDVLTYCIMSNHFHLLVRVPEKQEVSDQELLRRYFMLYAEEEISISSLTAMLQKNGKEAKAWRKLMLGRMGDVSVFMKMLKQRFSIWYNRSTERFGTLWAERFKSVLVENAYFALQIVASYIDLNPVRAGLCRDPKDYRYSGYGEAIGGSERARSGICALMRAKVGWTTAEREYRVGLFGQGAMPKAGGKPHIEHGRVKEVMNRGGQLSRAELLRCRVRYFSDGVVLGSEDFVQHQFEQIRDQLSPWRKSGPRPMQGGDWGGLTVLRDLQTDVIS